MDTIQSALAGAGSCFLIVLLSGLRLSRSGKPYRALILSIHKLVSLAAVAFLIMTAFPLLPAPKPGAIDLLPSVVAGLLFLSAIMSGGLLSTGKPMPVAILTMYRTIPFLTVLSTAVALYLLPGQRL